MPISAGAKTAETNNATTGAEVYASIKQGILSNTYRAGAQIHESELAVEFGVSRTPIREALVRLEAEGLVETLRRKGVRVLPVSATDMREIYDVLMALEAMSAAQLAARGPTSEELSGLRDAIEKMEVLYDSNDLEAWAKGDDEFHRELLRLNGNERVIAITDLLYSQAHRTQMITLRMRDDLEVSNQEHRVIVNALETGDIEAARNAMHAHRSRGGTHIARILETYGLPPL